MGLFSGMGDAVCELLMRLLLVEMLSASSAALRLFSAIGTRGFAEFARLICSRSIAIGAIKRTFQYRSFDGERARQHSGWRVQHKGPKVSDTCMVLVLRIRSYEQRLNLFQ